MRRDDLRNIVIIAHVDHGKTTLVDCLLHQSGQFRESQLSSERILDSNDLEKERGITILAKNIALPYNGVKINIVDTPGHADFGGEVERVLSMADGAVVLVDAAEGPMPQTRFVLSKALEVGLKPIVLVNKIDKMDARPHEVVDEVLDLFLSLGAHDDIADFPYLFASAKAGFASEDPDVREGDMRPLLDLVLKHIPGPDVNPDDPLQMRVTTLDWSEYTGRIAIGRIKSGKIKKGQSVLVSKADGEMQRGRIVALHAFENLGRVEVEEGTAGDIIAVTGLEDIDIGDTICSPDKPNPLPRVAVDAPTLEMMFTINTSPLLGKDGKYVTSRNLRDRLEKELERNVALRVRPGETADSFLVSGRGVLHLAVLIETMRREGYELAVGKPQVIMRSNNGVKEEPYEQLVIEVPSEKMGPVMELVGERRGELVEMQPRGDYTQVIFTIPSRGLIGLRTKLLNSTQGEAIVNHRFEEYRPVSGDVPRRANGAMISMVSGKAVGFALFALQERSDMFVRHGDEVYEGMIVGENSRSDDLTVNPTKEKKLTNMRASGSDENIVLRPPRDMSLEVALEYIEDDELVEVTPNHIRLRKILLKETDRRRQSRK
ncbi:translational GTPase TypA [Blastopirellula marina]|uniref:Large ribosomal subunit assembly factor BipA n=1 Tax=Blastopirellula marina TaxID=124 RepID=A0A2S8G8Q1_9BACT|nr:translational GTPase TypA [Blastopirellula marina]PQO40836.1 translational GTPase TypA [Blastopirellula marina]PTL45718.1 translational GTPase TypA [Blastopirellula marina]